MYSYKYQDSRLEPLLSIRKLKYFNFGLKSSEILFPQYDRWFLNDEKNYNF